MNALSGALRVPALLAMLAQGGVVYGEEDFARCLAGLAQQAAAAGLSDSTVNEVVPGLQQQPQVLRLDRAQPEFTQTFAQYLDRRVTQQRIQQGQRNLARLEEFLRELTDTYGVPGRYLVALWGLETNYGSFLGSSPTLDSLATLACDGRRGEYFTRELLEALGVMERESLAPAQLRGSWAGAVGHTQFMPSNYLRYAVDGDGDGRIDLWRSERDALASGANLLAQLGWERGQRWGREVLLPDKFPYVDTGLTQRRPLREWAALGVTATDGSALPALGLEAAILLPAGHQGPAFLAYANFEVLMRWNRSENYALSVGLLADRIVGAGNLVRAPSLKEEPLRRETVAALQERLNELDYAAGDVDGFMGPATRTALRAFQHAMGLVADGYPDRTTLRSLGLPNSP